MPHIPDGSSGDQMLHKTISKYSSTFVVCLTGLVLASFLAPGAVAQSTSPTTAIFFSGTQGNDGWFTSDVTVSMNASGHGGLVIDRTEYNFNGSDSGWIQYTGPFKITREGTTWIYYRSIDNSTAYEQTKISTVKIDKTPPLITYVMTPAPNANGWTTHNVWLHYEVSDDVSGVKPPIPQDLNLTNEGVYSSLTGVATDIAGNTASLTIPTIGIDRTPPQISDLTMQGNGYVGDYIPVSAHVVENNPQRMEWDFGDGIGTQAKVKDDWARVSHAYKQPGSYRITLDVIDMAGNAVKSTATVIIYGTVPTSQTTTVPTPTATPTPTMVPLPSAPAPAPAPGLLLLAIAIAAAGFLTIFAKRK